MSMSYFYYGESVDSTYRAFCAKVLAAMRAGLAREVRLHPGKYTPEVAPEPSERAAAAEVKWDPLNRFGSDYTR